MLARAVRDEELRAIRILAFIRHADHAPRVMGEGAIEFVREVFVPDGRAAFARPRRIAALEHEVADVSVEDDAVIVALFAQLYEVPHGFGGEFREEFEVDGAVVCGDAGVAGLFDTAGLEHVFFVG